ncbi:hypothetical protein [Winogradskyella forsetii]|uniref:hypothetical protein n=1 Tax=Winogradskyella forsetii TaxID=2686077 RepID=UPI0015BD8AD7|nr:hypothetical protein [Winogradskyella forsetii]
MKLKIVFLFLLLTTLCFAQKGILNGQLILDVQEDYINVANKTKVFVEIGKRIDSTFVNDSLQFSFENLNLGKARVFFKPPGLHTIDYFLKINKKNNEIKKLQYSLTCLYDRSIDNNTCPKCHKSDNVIPILYGLIMDRPIFFKNKKELRKIKKERRKEKKTFILGGCVITNCDPNWYCQKDEFEF